MDSTQISLIIRIESLRKGDLSIMQKLKKGQLWFQSWFEMCHITRERKVK